MCIYVHTDIQIYRYTDIYIYIYLYVCIYIYIYTHRSHQLNSKHEKCVSRVSFPHWASECRHTIILIGSLVGCCKLQGTNVRETDRKEREREREFE